jgi:O-acetyl-ADP-ribose deacetylase (regulator of RNase III)
VKLHLVDVNPAMVFAWEIAFRGVPAIEIFHGSIFDTDADAIVSPANSFGFMDGSLDLAISRYFGWHVQERLQALIREQHDGELLVGCAEVIETNHAAVPFVISAPTMRVPMYLGPQSVNPYLASRAALRAATRHGGIRAVAFSGMGTGVGQIPVDICARQMRQAYDDVFSVARFPESWVAAQVAHQHLFTDSVRDIQFKINAH